MSPRKRQMRADMLSVVVPDAAIHTMAGKMSKMQTASKTPFIHNAEPPLTLNAQPSSSPEAEMSLMCGT